MESAGRRAARAARYPAIRGQGGRSGEPDAGSRAARWINRIALARRFCRNSAGARRRGARAGLVRWRRGAHEPRRSQQAREKNGRKKTGRA
jgi:hypothetical protein